MFDHKKAELAKKNGAIDEWEEQPKVLGRMKIQGEFEQKNTCKSVGDHAE